ncbi:MAG: hypothetical protein ACKO8O_06740, partial [Betaproteobacteria bacterium]
MVTEAVAMPRQRPEQWLAIGCLLGPAAVLLIAFYAIPFIRMLAESLLPASGPAGGLAISFEHYE